MAYPQQHKDGFCLYKVAAGTSAAEEIFETLTRWSSYFSYEEARTAVMQEPPPRDPYDVFAAPPRGFDRRSRLRYRRRPGVGDGNWVRSDYTKLPEDLYFVIPVELYMKLTAPETNELGEVHP